MFFSDVQGHSLELCPENNTLIQIQGTRITRSELVVDEDTSIRCNPLHKDHKIHSGVFDSSKIAIHKISINKNEEDEFFKLKGKIMEKDKLLVDSLTSHPRMIRYLGTYFNLTKLEACLITDFFAGCTMKVIYKYRNGLLYQCLYFTIPFPDYANDDFLDV